MRKIFTILMVALMGVAMTTMVSCDKNDTTTGAIRTTNNGGSNNDNSNNGGNNNGSGNNTYPASVEDTEWRYLYNTGGATDYVDIYVQFDSIISSVSGDTTTGTLNVRTFVGDILDYLYSGGYTYSKGSGEMYLSRIYGTQIKHTTAQFRINGTKLTLDIDNRTFTLDKQ